MNPIVAAILMTVAVPDAPPAKLVQKPDRMTAIYEAMADRLAKQNDHWFEDGDYPRCIQSLRLSVAMEPSDWESATNLGWLLESTENNAEALAVYVRFRKQNPTYPDAAFPEANFYFRKRLFAKVPPLLEPSLRLKSNPHPNTYRILAHSYERLGLLNDSKRVWEALLKVTPDDGAAKVNLNRVVGKIRGGGEIKKG